MRAIQLHALTNVEHLVQPEDFDELSVNSPALAIFTDFKKHKPLMMDSQTTALSAEQEMLRTHVKMKLVVDAKRELVGVISFEDICKQNIVKMAANGYQQSEILVTDLMRHRSELKVLDFNDIAHARIGDVIETLKQNGVQHCLVVDSQHHHIRGLISASDIARKLKLNISIQYPPSFVDIFNAVREKNA